MALSFASKSFACRLGLFIVLIAFSCQEENKPASEKVSAECKNPSAGMNPNGSSELSQLMRTMQSWCDSAKEIIAHGNLPATFPESFRNIYTAQPTDAETKKPSFSAFASEYLRRLELLSRSSKDSLNYHYNAVIDACLSCHGDHCPGPIKAINKLKL